MLMLMQCKSIYARLTLRVLQRAQQGLPIAVLITVPPADTRTTLCYQLLRQGQSGVEGQVWVPVVSESA